MSILAVYSTKSDFKSEENSNLLLFQNDSTNIANSPSELSISKKLYKKTSLLRDNPKLNRKSTFLDADQIKSLKRIQKRVKFEEQVEVIIVESWKDYNNLEIGTLEIMESAFTNTECRCKCLIV